MTLIHDLNAHSKKKLNKNNHNEFFLFFPYNMSSLHPRFIEKKIQYINL